MDATSGADANADDEVLATAGPRATRSRRARRWRAFALVAGPLFLLLALIQLIPYRVTNPPVVREPNWDSPRTRELAVRACFDCHSNETNTLWFEDIAPLSWWITNHVEEGRSALNFSEWGRGEADDVVEATRNGSMPPDYYTWLGLHSDAKLSARERQELADGLRRTIQQSGGGGGG